MIIFYHFRYYLQYEKSARKEIINSMAEIIDVADINIPELEIYTHLTDARLRKVYEYEHGIFIAESQTVIEVALDAGCKPISMLTDRKYINDRANGIIERCGDITVYTADSKIMSGLTGYELTRGMLCAMERPAPKGQRSFAETHEGLPYSKYSRCQQHRSNNSLCGGTRHRRCADNPVLL